MIKFWKKKEETAPMFVIAGLGNPTQKYENTRHNVGFDVIDVLAGKYNIKVSVNKHRTLCGTGIVEGQKTILAKPQTFMNLSGESIGKIMDFYKLNPADRLIVIYDDINLAPGKLRIREKGSAGGHNGVKSIIAHIGTQEFMRIKVGVGNKPEGWDLADFVLSRFSKDERILVEEAVENAAAAAVMMMRGEVENAMNRYNQR